MLFKRNLNFWDSFNAFKIIGNSTKLFLYFNLFYNVNRLLTSLFEPRVAGVESNRCVKCATCSWYSTLYTMVKILTSPHRCGHTSERKLAKCWTAGTTTRCRFMTNRSTASRIQIWVQNFSPDFWTEYHMGGKKLLIK